MRLFSSLFVLALLVSGCSSEDGNNTPTAPSANVAFSTTDLRVGTGAEATTGRAANVNYSLWLYSATGIDNKGRSIQTGNFTFTVGTGVIPGFSQGVQGMKVGGLRRIVVPPNLGYGAAGQAPDIPGNATLIFEVELLAVQQQ